LLRPFYVSPPILALAMVGPVALFLDLRRAAKVRTIPRRRTGPA
jgi:hypothetical protein